MNNQTVTQYAPKCTLTHTLIGYITWDDEITPVLPEKDQLAFVRVLQDTDKEEEQIGSIPYTEVMYEELPQEADISTYLKYTNNGNIKNFNIGC